MATVPQSVSDVTKDSPGQQAFLEKVAPDEPIFILRGRDALAERVIQAWIHMARDHGVDAKKIAAAKAHRDLFNEYACFHKTRLPD